jgi:DNA-directed RNA polymerase subunit RPC12/RpoP
MERPEVISLDTLREVVEDENNAGATCEDWNGKRTREVSADFAIVCPHCGYKTHDYNEWIGNDLENHGETFECESCCREFELSWDFTINFTAKAPAYPEDQTFLERIGVRLEETEDAIDRLEKLTAKIESRKVASEEG